MDAELLVHAVAADGACPDRNGVEVSFSRPDVSPFHDIHVVPAACNHGIMVSFAMRYVIPLYTLLVAEGSCCNAVG
jgi:hypothetical protein